MASPVLIPPRLQKIAKALISAAIAAVNPAECVRRALTLNEAGLRVGDHTLLRADDYSRVVLLGAGKASVLMGAALVSVLDAWGKITARTLPLEGHIVTKYGHADAASLRTLSARGVRVSEAGHPTPDAAGVASASELLRLARSSNDPRCLVFLVLSGGGSSLLPAPVDGVSLEDLRGLSSALLGCGANINEINTVRKHVSRIAGGQLAAACGSARLVTLVLSDVIGDRLDVIASGPTVPDTSTFSDALEVLDKYGLRASAAGAVSSSDTAVVQHSNVADAAHSAENRSGNRIPESVLLYLTEGANGRAPETLKSARPSDIIALVGSNSLATAAVAATASKLGFLPVRLSSRIQGEAREVGGVFAAMIADAAGAPTTSDDVYSTKLSCVVRRAYDADDAPRRHADTVYATLGNNSADASRGHNVTAADAQRGHDDIVADASLGRSLAAHDAPPCSVAQLQLGKAGRRSPLCIIAGGETTVRLHSNSRSAAGVGGRNTELSLAAALALDDLLSTGEDAAATPSHCALIALATDGSDGPTDSAGALVTSHTCSVARRLGLDPAAYLAAHDSYSFFRALHTKLTPCAATGVDSAGGHNLGAAADRYAFGEHRSDGRVGAAAAVFNGTGRGSDDANVSEIMIESGGLLITGPSGTNVMDVSIMLTDWC